MDMERWNKCAQLHGHECPGLAIGVRCTQLAEETLGVKFPVDGAVCVKEKDMCGCDGVRCITGCTEDNGRLLSHPTEKVAFSYFLPEGKSVRVEYVGQARPGDPDKQAKIRHILDDDAQDQFKITKPDYDIPAEG